LGALVDVSGGLAAQERRYVELIVVWGDMHGGRAAMDVQALRGSPLGIFRNRIRPT
jgi:hypothetical protein